MLAWPQTAQGHVLRANREYPSVAALSEAVAGIVHRLDVLADPEFPPEWSAWGKEPVMLWQAVALSLDSDPGKLVGGWDGAAVIRTMRWKIQPLAIPRTTLFVERLKYAEDRIEKEFPAQNPSEPKHHSFVNLEPFARWAIERAHWPVPTGFSIFANLVIAVPTADE